MRYLLSSIGFLALLMPTGALAQCPSSPGAAALASADPLGIYAQKAMERVNAGIAKAKGARGGSDAVDFFSLHYIDIIRSVFYMLYDTDLHAVEYKRDLTVINSCMHYDLAIMEAKMEEIRCETLQAYNRGSAEGIRLLKSVADFLNQRYKHIVKGGLHTEHVDKSWPFYFDFDDPFQGWCCNLNQLECQVKTADECEHVMRDGGGGEDFYPTKDACLTDSNCFFADDGNARAKYVEQCPFDSDYMAPSTNGYGCDLSVLEKINEDAIPGVTAEIEALQDLAATRDEFLSDIEHIRNTTLKMDILANRNMLNEQERAALARFGQTSQEEIEHKRVYGCNADLTPEEREGLEPPEGEEENSGTKGDLTEDIRPSQEWIRMPLRTAFFFQKDHLEIWKAFFRLHSEWSEIREFPNYLKNPDEFPEEEGRKKAMERDETSFRLIRIPRNYIRTFWKIMHGTQETKDAGIIPKAQDMTLQVREAMQPIRPAMSKNIELVQDTERGMRRFSINFAYYLRRSCLYRPCNQRLETILQTLFSDECFPYAKTGKGEWEKCRGAVEKLRRS